MLTGIEKVEVGAKMPLILLIPVLLVLWLIIEGLRKGYRDQTGVKMPSRSQARYIRRKARKSGISEAQAHDEWLERKQKKKN